MCQAVSALEELEDLLLRHRTDVHGAYTGKRAARISSMSRTAAFVTHPARPLALAATVDVPPQIVTRSLAPPSITSTLPDGAASIAANTARLSPGMVFSVNAGPKGVGRACVDLTRNRIATIGSDKVLRVWEYSARKK